MLLSLINPKPAKFVLVLWRDPCQKGSNSTKTFDDQKTLKVILGFYCYEWISVQLLTEIHLITAERDPSTVHP